MSKQLLGYIVLDKFDDLISKLKERVYETYEFEKPPYLQLNNKGEVTLYIQDKNAWVRTGQWAIENYLNRLEMKTSYQFIADSLNVYNRRAEEMLNNIISVYWSERYTSIRKKKLVGHYVEDEFTKPEYRVSAVKDINQMDVLDYEELRLANGDDPISEDIPKDALGEVRYISTTLFKRLSDHGIGNFIMEHLDNDYEFLEGIMKPLMSSFKYASDTQVEIDGDTTRLGLGFSNSEFGARLLDIGIYSIRLSCSNQFISRNLKFRETVVHRRKDADEFKIRVRKAIKSLGGKLETYANAIRYANATPLKHVLTMDDIIEHPVNKRFARLPDNHTKGIIEAFNEDPVYNKKGEITKWSLFNACTRYIQDNKSLEDNPQLVATIDTLITA